MTTPVAILPMRAVDEGRLAGAARLRHLREDLLERLLPLREDPPIDVGEINRLEEFADALVRLALPPSLDKGYRQRAADPGGQQRQRHVQAVVSTWRVVRFWPVTFGSISTWRVRSASSRGPSSRSASGSERRSSTESDGSAESS